MNTFTPSYTQSRGVSLVELMIALALGTLLVAGLITLFINNKGHYLIQDGLSRMQENGRFAHYFLNTEIRTAGFQGCSNLNQRAPNILVASPPADVRFSTNDIINGYESTGTNTWSPTLPAAISGNVLTGTDALVIRKASSAYTTLSENMSSSAAAISTNDHTTLAAANILFITDCETADLFRASAGTSNTSIAHGAGADNTTSVLAKAYQTDAVVRRFEVFYFYVANTGRTNATGLPISALFRRDLNGNVEELVEGVTDMQIQYGLDTNNDDAVDTYANAQTVNTNNQWNVVMSVSISLLLNSVEEVNPQPQRYQFMGTSVTPNNRLLHREWNYFITLRNRAN